MTVAQQPTVIDDQATLPWRVGGVSGIGFVVVALIAFLFLPGVPPALEAPIGEIRSYFVDHNSELVAGLWVSALAYAVFLMVFAASLRHVLRVSDRSIWPTVSMIGAVLIVAMGGLGASFWLFAAYLVFDGLGDDTLRVLFAGDLLVFGVFAPWVMALFTGAAATSIRTTRLLPSWSAISGLIVSILLVIGTLWIFTGDEEGLLAIVGLAGFLLWLIWVFTISVLMVRRTSSTVVSQP